MTKDRKKTERMQLQATRALITELILEIFLRRSELPDRETNEITA